MLLLLIIYGGVGIDCLVRRQFVLACLCFMVPFMSSAGMVLSVVLSIYFGILGQWIEAVVPAAYLIFCLVGNWLVMRKEAIPPPATPSL